MIPVSVYFGILLELVVVSWVDIKKRKISNKWTIANIILFIILLFVFPEYYIFTWKTFMYSGMLLAITFVLFLLNVMGGGDSKFLFSFFLIVPLKLQEQAFYYLLVSTVITGLIFFVMNTAINYRKLIEYLKNKDIQGVKSCFGSKFAFAPVILLSWLSVGWLLREAF